MYRIIMACGMMLALSGNASAYLDPSVMTYTIQVVAGVVVAVGAVIGVYWRKRCRIRLAWMRTPKRKSKRTWLKFRIPGTETQNHEVLLLTKRPKLGVRRFVAALSALIA